MRALTIEPVVNFGLCTRCGACCGVCPTDAINWDEDNFPKIGASCNRCALCVSVCGGIGLNYPFFSKRILGTDNYLFKDAIGTVRNIIVAHSCEPQLRNIAASGGLASQIPLSLLINREIDGSVVTGFAPENPLLPIAKIARSCEEIYWGVQSKYVLFPVAHIYREIIENPGRYVVIGLPCQIHSLRKWQRINSVLRKSVVLVVGLCCQGNLEIRLLRDLLAVKKISERQVKRLEFRGGKWPGSIRVTFLDGTIRRLHSGDFKDHAIIYLKNLYMAKRCQLCPDYANDFADISISDPWIRRDDGHYMFEGGWSLAYVRTDRGDKVIEQLRHRGEIVTKPVKYCKAIKHTRDIKLRERRGVFIRLNKRKKKGLPIPDFGTAFPPLNKIHYKKEALFQLSLVGLNLKKMHRFFLWLAFSRLGEKVKKYRSRIKTIKYQKLMSNKAVSSKNNNSRQIIADRKNE